MISHGIVWELIVQKIIRYIYCQIFSAFPNYYFIIHYLKMPHLSFIAIASFGAIAQTVEIVPIIK